MSISFIKQMYIFVFREFSSPMMKKRYILIYIVENPLKV